MTDLRGRIVWRLAALVRPPVTLGARCLVIDEADRVVLVRHTYMGGWHLPGGGVDPGETAAQAAAREFREETGLDLPGAPVLFGLYWNRHLAGRDHVALYVAEGVPALQERALKPQASEIAEVILAPVAALPDDAVPSVHRRIAEVRTGEARSEVWS